jgi:hypothetical protein
VTAGQAQIAGAVAAGMALAVGEVVTAMGGNGQSLVGSVGSAFIDQAGGDVARTAINIFSTGDKPALIVGIVIISLLIGAALGSASRRRPWAGPVGFAAFGLVGVVASSRDELASTGLAVVAAVLAVAAGSAHPLGPPAGGAAGAPPHHRPGPSRATGPPDRPARLAPRLLRLRGRGRRVRRAGRHGRSQVAAGPLHGGRRRPGPDPAARPHEPGGAAVGAGGVPRRLFRRRPRPVVPAADFYRIDTALTVPG